MSVRSEHDGFLISMLLISLSFLDLVTPLWIDHFSPDPQLLVGSAAPTIQSSHRAVIWGTAQLSSKSHFPVPSLFLVWSYKIRRNSQQVRSLTDECKKKKKKRGGLRATYEIKRCLLLGRQVMTNLDSIFKSRYITLSTKVRLVRLWFFQWSCMDVRVGLWRKLSIEELMLLNCGVGEDSWESLGLQGDPTSPS